MTLWEVTKRWVPSKRITDAGGLSSSEIFAGITDGLTMSSDSLTAGNLNMHIENPSKIITTQQLRLFVGTWNVGGRAPTTETRESMQEWLMGSPHPHADEPAADIYVIGFQEIVPLNAGNILGMNLKDGTDAGLLASNKWEALISATLNKISSNRHTSNSIYFDDKIDTVQMVTTTSAPILHEKANDENDDTPAMYDQHNDESYAKSHQYDGGCPKSHQYDRGCSARSIESQCHDWHNGNANTKTHDRCECRKATNLVGQYSGVNNNDKDNNSGDNSYSNHVKIDKQDHTNHQNVQYMGHYAFASATHAPPFSEQNNATPSSSTDSCRIYTTPPSTRGIVPLAEMDPDVHFAASADRCMYTGIARKHMVGLFISVWVRHTLQHHIKAVQVSSVGCGIMNRLGNKGAVSVSLSVDDTRLCFICTHLRSGDKPGDASRRNSDVNHILQRTRFYCSKKPWSKASLLPTTILAHDRIIWLGDLNYRLTLSATELQDFLIREDWKALIETDELKREKGVGGVFEGWHEGGICFAPTYKYRINSNTYSMLLDAKDGSKRRSPAWCDRILWHGKGLKQLSYTRCESKHSDHRPVRSYFMVEVESLGKASGLTTCHLTSQSIEPFLAEVKELLSTTNLNINPIMLSKYNSLK